MQTVADGGKKARSKDSSPAEASSLIVNNITAKWNQDMVKPTLKDISTKLKPGDLLAVIGPVGSGKVSVKFRSITKLILFKLSVGLYF